MSIDIVPAIIPTSRQAVLVDCERLAFSPELHLDVVDGDFVSAVSWPYDPVDDLASVQSALAAFTLEVDLMVRKPLPAAAAWCKAGADMLVFHVETVTVAELAHFDSQTNCTIGISANNDTPLETLMSYVPYADYIQVMGIATIGSQGQPFDERALERITLIKEAGVRLPISVDGSVNQATIARVAASDVDRLIAGSAIVKADAPETAYQALKELAR